MNRIDVNDLVLLDDLQDEGLLGPLGTKHLAERRALEAEVRASREQQVNLSKRVRLPTAFFDAEPTKGTDQIALAVLHDADGLGSTLANVVTKIGETGLGPSRKQWVWQGPGLQFVTRETFAGIKRSPEVRSRLLLLAPTQKEVGNFADLFGLLAASPLRLRHVQEVWCSIVRSTTSLELLELWAAHHDTRRDVQRRQVIANRIARVRRAQPEAATE